MGLNWEEKKRDENLEPYSTIVRKRMLKGIGPVFGMYYYMDVLPKDHFSAFKGDGSIKQSDILYLRVEKQTFTV